jgi:uncharacterized protein (TIGR02444 family)
MDRPIDLTGPHWAFSLDVYGQPTVPASCLLLQDRCGVDVNVLLLCLFAACRGAPTPSEQDIAALDGEIERLRREVVVPLRQIRRAMKIMPEADLGREFDSVRNRVKSAELAAEQLQQAMLARLLPDGSPRGDFDALATARAVVGFYAGRTGSRDAMGDEDIERAIASVAEAAQRAGGRS